MDQALLCPFSKPIIGQWCRCAHARLADRCSGKMWCTAGHSAYEGCSELFGLLKDNARFLLGQATGDSQLTHAQLMKVRCGGLRGMQRVLSPDSDGAPAVLDIIDRSRSAYGTLADFPYREIMPDIQRFSHRRKLRDKA
jgi:hypothetical protein